MKEKPQGSRQQNADEIKAMWQNRKHVNTEAASKIKKKTGMMVDNICFAHPNASSFVKSEMQHMILKQLGKKVH